jgi:hypothetical protein
VSKSREGLEDAVARIVTVSVVDALMVDVDHGNAQGHSTGACRFKVKAGFVKRVSAVVCASQFVCNRHLAKGDLPLFLVGDDLHQYLNDGIAGLG